MNKVTFTRYCGFSLGLLGITTLPALAEPHGPYAAPYETSVYSPQAAEPTCCYSGQRLWKQTNAQSGWSINARQFDPNGFPSRDRYRHVQPAPLPRDAQGGNPWSVSRYATPSYYQRPIQQSGYGSNAQYFQPAYYNYPAPVSVGTELEYVPSGFTGLGDPYLTGLAYPYGAGPAYDSPFIPGLAPGLFPAAPAWGYSPFWPGGGW